LIVLHPPLAADILLFACKMNMFVNRMEIPIISLPVQHPKSGMKK